MPGKKVNANLFCLGLAFIAAVTSSHNAFAQTSSWYFPAMPWQTYYTAPSYNSVPACSSGSCGTSQTWAPSCTNGSCGVRQAPIQRMPANTVIQPTYSVQPTYGTARPTFQPTPPPSQPIASQPAMTQSKTWQPSANRESPFYEDRQTPAKQPAPVPQSNRLQLPTQTPAAPTRNNNSPFYP